MYLMLTSISGLTCAAAPYLSGQRHGDTVLYKYDQFPEGALGPVNFLWRAEGGFKSSSKPEETTTVDQEGMLSVRKANKLEDSSVRQMWVWAHPACTEVLVKELQTACENENKNAGKCQLLETVNRTCYEPFCELTLYNVWYND